MFASILLSLVMSWVVETKSSVSGEGDIPGSAHATYACTYQKGTVRKGDTATFVLTNIGGIQVEKVEIYLRSNKSAGAGEISMWIDENLVSQRSGTLRDLVGQYDNTEFHAVELVSGQYGVRSELQIQVTGTANSLYIEKYVIRYSPAPAYSVDLMAGNEKYTTLYEPSGGAGVRLPELDDREGVRFAGWSETEFYTIYTVPEIIPAGEYYFPQTNTTLWSVWIYANGQETSFVTDLQSGEYVYANSATSMAMSGVPAEGRMGAAPINPDDVNQIYSVRFLTPETATIHHTATDTPIGYSGTKITDRESVWQVYHNGDTTVFYMEDSGKTYALFLPLYDVSTSDFYAGLAQTSHFSLMVGLVRPYSATGQTAYTCHPECGEGNELVPAREGDFMVPFGIYEIHIKDGKKHIRLRM